MTQTRAMQALEAAIKRYEKGFYCLAETQGEDCLVVKDWQLIKEAALQPNERPTEDVGLNPFKDDPVVKTGYDLLMRLRSVTTKSGRKYVWRDEQRPADIDVKKFRIIPAIKLFNSEQASGTRDKAVALIETIRNTTSDTLRRKLCDDLERILR